MKNRILYLVSVVSLAYSMPMLAQSDVVNKFSIEWNTPSQNASGSMPIGNGEVGANVWMEENGNMVFYLARTDAFSENSSLYKLGRIRVSTFPKLEGAEFHQFLNLEEGKIEVEMKKGGKKLSLDFLVDSESPVAYIKGESTYPVSVTVSSEIWRTQTRLIPKNELTPFYRACPRDSLVMEYADIVNDKGDDLVVYHRNEHSIYPFTVKSQQLADEENLKQDPFMNRTFGYEVRGNGFKKISPTIIGSEKPVNDFCLKIATHTEQTATAENWEMHIEKILADAPSFEKVEKRTAAWWKAFWDKSYVVINTPDKKTGEKITQSYILQNWMTACSGRGNYPIKFNGSLFTVEPVYTNKGFNFNPDFRQWGPEYWWQNTRLMYHPMLKTGDFDMMLPLFNLYFSNLKMLQKQVEVFYGAEGITTPETMTVFGTFDDFCFDWYRKGNTFDCMSNYYIRYYWSSALELIGLMYDYYQYSLDQVFVNNTLIPMAREVLKFYNSYFPKDETGMIRITPTHALETYWDGVENDMPNIAGLHYVLDNLLSLPKGHVSVEDLAVWKKMRQALPEIPVHQVEGKKLFAPAEKYEDKRSNVENPELYAIFPFSYCNISTSNLQVGIDSYHNRVIKTTSCWSQDGQMAARLGLTDEVKNNVLFKIENSHPGHRFPVYWGPNYDWAPDQDHGGNFLTTIQEMVMQSYGNTVYMLPAFPKDWDVNFKLYTFGNNTVSGTYKDGKWVEKPSFGKKTKMRIRQMKK